MALGHCTQYIQTGNVAYNMPAGKQYSPIAPAPMTKSVLGMNGSNVQPRSDDLANKAKYTYTNMPYGEQPQSVVRRNARERNRVKQVNNGFVTLRQHIPQTVITSLSNGGRGASKKLSKVDTLRIAVEYIRSLKDLIEEADSCSESSSNSSFSSSSLGSTAGSPPPATYYSSSSSAEQYHSMSTSYAATSPAPSFASENSNGSSHNYMQHTPPPQPAQQMVQFKYEPYENYSSFPSASDDEELLDYISLWQEQ